MGYRVPAYLPDGHQAHQSGEEIYLRVKADVFRLGFIDIRNYRFYVHMDVEFPDVGNQDGPPCVGIKI